MPVYNVQAPNGKIYKVEGPENADPKTLFGFVQQQVESDDVRRLQKEYGPGVLGTFGRGVKRSAGELASTFTDIIPAMAGSALGYDEYAKEQLAEADKKRIAREAESPTMFRSYKEVEGIGDVPRYLAETVGEQVANIGTALIPGVGAGALATRAGLSAAGKAAAVGAGTYLGSYAQNAPEIFQNIERETGQLEPGAAAIWGAGSAALDSILPAKLGKQLTGPMKMGIVEKVLEKSGMDKSLLRSVTAGMAGGVATEGLTEGAQEAISIAAEKFVSDNPQIFGSKEWDRIMESAVKGAVGGGAFGTVGGAVERGRAAAQRREEYAQALEKRGERQLAAEVRRQSAEIEAEQAQNPQAELPGFETGPYMGLVNPPVAETDQVKALREKYAGIKEPKELKGKQGELFTPEGELTPGVAKAATRAEKIEANKQRQEEQRQAAELKEAQAKLKKFLSAKQTTLPGFDEASIKDLQAQTAAQQQAAAESGQGDLFNPQPVQPTTTPAVTPEVQPAPPATVLNDTVLKDMGIGPTSLIRKNKILEGMDISNPEDAADVKRILEAYVENRSQPIREKVEAFLARPEFQGATDAARPDAQPVGSSAVVPSQPDIRDTAPAAEPTEPDGVVPTGEVVGEPVTREAEQPAALKTPKKQREAAVKLDENGRGIVFNESVLGGLRRITEDDDIASDYPSRNGAVMLTGLDRQAEGEKGRASDALQALTKWADTNNEKLVLMPSASGELSQSDLTSWYERNGFVTQSDGAMERAPATKEPKKLGKRAQKDLAKAEAGAAAAQQEQATFVQEVDNNVDSILTARLREAGREANLNDSDLPSDTYRGSDAHNLLRLPSLFAQYRDSESLAKEFVGTPQEAKNLQQIQQIEQEIANSGPDALAMFQQLRTLPIQRQDQMLAEINRVALQEFDKQAKATVAKVQAEIAAQKNEQKELTDEELDALTNDFATKFFEQTGRKIFLPQYEGPAFNQADAALAQKGDLNGLLRSMLDQIKDPAIKQVLRRLRSLNMDAKVVIAPVEDGKAGSYDPATNTITLDPQNGLNAHTFIHETVHAAISKVLANPNHPLTKSFNKLFMQIKDRMGATYGAQDLQEFAAELVGNPSFQALLKTIKTPKSDSLFKNIMRNIAEFFGFVPKTTAFDTGLNFINNAIDLSGDVQPTASAKMFQGMGNFAAVGAIGRAMPPLTGQVIESTRNFLSNLQGSGVQGAAFGLMRLDNINDLYKKQLPSIQSLLDALEKRNGTQERMIKTVNSNYHNFRKVEEKFRPQMQRMSDIAIDARLAQVDLLNPNFQPDATNQAEYTRLSTAFRALPKEVQDVYRTIREAYDGSFKQYMKILHDAANSVSPSLAARLNEQFSVQKPLVGYVPFLRSGDFWVEFTDPKTGEPAAQAFDSIRERQQFINTELKGIPNRAYQNLEDARFTGEGLPPTSFIMQVMNGMRNNKATQQQLDSVYQAYLTTFPAQSIMKQFMKAKNVAGMERDIISGYGDVMVRWARKLSNSEYVPQIDRALNQIKQEAGAQGDNPTITAAAQNIIDQSAFFHNPSFGTFTSAATTLSYAEYILGNISSALVNITSLPMLVYPMLTGKYGWADATAAMTAASKTAMNDWSKNARYKNLYNTLMDHAQLEHTMAREVLEGRRQKTSDYLGVKARILDGLSIPFAATEKYNRGVTAIAAYDLARKSGMSEEKAVRYALDTVKNVHTSGLAATGPKWMQTPMGRLFFTFKSFVWNSAYVMARAFHQSFKGETPEIRKAAQRQLLATYGMATVFTGVKGMPFYGAISVLAQMINALFGDEEEPFDFDEFLRDIFGEFLYKGAFNYATNLEISNRAGIATDLLFRDDPRGIAEHGYVLSAMQQAFGPAGTIAVNAGNAVKMLQDGHVERAIETVAPSFVRNVMKGTRYMIEGATTLKGDPVMEDISVYNSLMQGIGFSPADLSSQYERVQAAKGYEREVLLRRTQLLQNYDMGHTAGDFDLMSETREKIQAFNEAHTKYKITPETIQKSIRARKAAEKEMVYGVRFNKKLRGEIEDRFFDDEE